MRSLGCIRCGKQLHFLKREKLQLGETGVFLGSWGNILAGSLEAEIYCCPGCGKIELYCPEEFVMEQWEQSAPETEELPPEVGQNIVGVSRDGIPQVKCPACGKTHDFDYPQCPYCEHVYL